MAIYFYGSIIARVLLYIDLVYENVISKGAESVMKSITEPWGQRTCYIADPEGNLIEIGSLGKNLYYGIK